MIVNSASSGVSSTSKIGFVVISSRFHGLDFGIFTGVGPSWNGEIKGGAFTRLGVGPDSAAVLVNHPRYARQPNTRAGELADGVESLKRSKQLGGVRHVEAGSVVADAKNVALISSF